MAAKHELLNTQDLSHADLADLFAEVGRRLANNGAVLARLLGDVQPASTPASTPSTPEPGPRMLSRLEVAKRIAVSKITVSRMVKRKSFPAPVRVGSQLRWRLSDIEGWEREA